MGLCKFCNKQEANKKNTHYLTHSIIKYALNHKGCSKGYKGNIYTIGEDGYIKHSFQRETPPEVIEQAKGRPATEEEIIEAENDRTFSVDDVFCPECEKKFGIIEDKFIREILPQLKATPDKEIVINDIKTIRLFFLLQIWRSSVCDPNFTLPPLTQEAIRKVLYEGLDVKEWKIRKFFLSVTYLKTYNDEDKTSNVVSVDSKNYWPRVIFMGEFVIQIYKSILDYDPLFGINDIKNYKKYINHNESEFIVQVLDNSERVKINENIFKQGANLTMKNAELLFKETWYKKKLEYPSDTITLKFLNDYSKMDSFLYDDVYNLINKTLMEKEE